MNGISVIIPSLHRTEFLINTLKDLVKQVCDLPFEIVIVDQSNEMDKEALNFCKEYSFCKYHHITFFKGLPELIKGIKEINQEQAIDLIHVHAAHELI